MGIGRSCIGHSEDLVVRIKRTCSGNTGILFRDWEDHVLDIGGSCSGGWVILYWALGG